MSNVYGSSGNRWWVGQNVGGSNAEKNIFGHNAIVPAGGIPGTPPSGYESLPSGSAADDAAFAAAAGKGGRVTVEGITWYNITGPYATQAQANAAIPNIQSASPAQGEIGQATGNAAGSGLGGIAAALAGLVRLLSDLTNWRAWTSLGWIVVGLLLFLIGVGLWVNKETGGSLGSLLRLAVL